MGKIKVADYIVKFLISKGITDVFGYPGGMVTHLMQSFDDYSHDITAHVNYNEQGSSFCACSYAQLTHKMGVAYATSGPGATNLITGIANAYYDSLPCLFLTGQVNTYEAKGNLSVRQKGFQEMDIVEITKSITKYGVIINDAIDIPAELEKAYQICTTGRCGPVLLDIPMNIQRAEINEPSFDFKVQTEHNISEIAGRILSDLSAAKRPLIIAGAGINSSNTSNEFLEFIENYNVPVVTSMIGIDILPTNHPLNFGFIGAYGHRYANLITEKSDLIISFGTRLDCRQTGSNRDIFATKSKLIRIDIDSGELTNKIKKDETQYIANLKILLPELKQSKPLEKSDQWVSVCKEIKATFLNVDDQYANQVIRAISEMCEDDIAVTTDVGQNQVWVAQSFQVKPKQRILFSGGHGAMGYSLPAAIGAYYATRKAVICFTGDGGLMMNIQELQFIDRERLPIKIILMNNDSLGMIRHFQEMYFNSNFVQTRSEKGYTTPDFEKISNSFNISYSNVDAIDQLKDLKVILSDEAPHFININLGDKTYVFPKLAINKPIYDQDPLMDRDLLDDIIKM